MAEQLTDLTGVNLEQLNYLEQQIWYHQADTATATTDGKTRHTLTCRCKNFTLTANNSGASPPSRLQMLHARHLYHELFTALTPTHRKETP